VQSFNLMQHPCNAKTVWLFQHGWITSLLIDLVEWSWLCIGQLKPSNFLDYQKKHKYMIGLQSLKIQMPLFEGKVFLRLNEVPSSYNCCINGGPIRFPAFSG
jgi:hypothetical protein